MDWLAWVIGFSTAGWVVTTWIRARHGYPITDDNGKTIDRLGDPELKRQNDLLARENETLRGKLGRLEDRLSVLERIATDTPNRLSAEIEQLR